MRFRSSTSFSASPYGTIYGKAAECTIGDGSETYGNTGSVEWRGWLGKYRHNGMRPPEFYYPNGPYDINSIKIAEGVGCHAVGVTGYTTYGASGGAAGELVTGSGDYSGSNCLILFGGQGGVSSTPQIDVNTNLGAFTELQKINKTESRIRFHAYPSPGPPSTTVTGIYSSVYEIRYICNECCDIQYMVVGGEFPPDLILDMDTGVAYGMVSEMDLPDSPGDNSSKDYFMKRWKLPEDYRINEKNYATVGSASAFANGLPANNTAKFVIRAFNAKDPRVFTDKEFSMRISNNWSSDRDRLILNINNKFFIDEKPVSNAEYLSKMKERGYFD